MFQIIIFTKYIKFNLIFNFKFNNFKFNLKIY